MCNTFHLDEDTKKKQQQCGILSNFFFMDVRKHTFALFIYLFSFNFWLIFCLGLAAGNLRLTFGLSTMRNYISTAARCSPSEERRLRCPSHFCQYFRSALVMSDVLGPPSSPPLSRSYTPLAQPLQSNGDVTIH